MATKIYNRTTPDGEQVMIKFGYADRNNEYYSSFADASKQNSGEGASYAAFVASADDTNPCWEWHKDLEFTERPLTAEEKKKFEGRYFLLIYIIEGINGGLFYTAKPDTSNL